MHTDLLEILRCPYCGTRLTLVDNDALRVDAHEVHEGVLGCACCAYPIVAGIPVLIADEPTRGAMHTLEAGRSEDALLDLLGLAGAGARQEEFRALTAGTDATYREALALLCEDAEGTYALHRLTDPTFRTIEALLRSLGSAKWPLRGRVLDLCGGSGHASWLIPALRPPGDRPAADSVLADVYFWKLWLARLVAPQATPVCCDANHPLPFAPDTFSTVLLADAFPYIWHKRLLAEEMTRLVGRDGVVLMPHLHSSLGENFSAGDTLSPAAYLDLFPGDHPRLFSDERLLDDVLERSVMDLTQDKQPEALGSEPSLTLVSSGRVELFDCYPLEPSRDVRGRLVVNPLYRLDGTGDVSVLTLAFPTPEYEEEFGACTRYLPDRVEVQADLTQPITPEALGSAYAELRDRRVIIDAPVAYC